MKVQVGFLVAYDYPMLKKSISMVYEHADDIFLAIDKNRMTWNGEKFFICDSFFKWIDEFDCEKKIVFYEDDFYIPSLTTMECEVRERKMLAQKMGVGNWILQLDADEYFVDFENFVSFLRMNNVFLESPDQTPVNILPFSINIYKKLDSGYLIVKESTKQWVATNWPDYIIGRKTRNPSLYNNSIMLHESIARSREELETKFRNWGHNTDFDANEYLERWESLDEHNYKNSSNFFYLDSSRWAKLTYLKVKSLSSLLSEKDLIKPYRKSEAKILLKNLKTYFKYFKLYWSR